MQIAAIEARAAPGLAAARAMLEAHFNERLGLAELAERAGLTRWDLIRAWRRAYGTTPHRALTALRVALARRLLADPAIAVEDVAIAAGFGSRTALYRNFQRSQGLSPTQWRVQSARAAAGRAAEAPAATPSAWTAVES